jgi:tRNA modification GTPase
MTDETIIALSTPPGVGAIAVIRLSGPGSRGIVDALVANRIDWQPQRAVYRELRHRGALLDDVVITFWRAPHSFTGEDIVEVSCHGNPRIVEAIVRTALELGARAARPGGFRSRRRRACSTCFTRRRSARWRAPAR